MYAPARLVCPWIVFVLAQPSSIQGNLSLLQSLSSFLTEKQGFFSLPLSHKRNKQAFQTQIRLESYFQQKAMLYMCLKQSYPE